MIASSVAHQLAACCAQQTSQLLRKLHSRSGEIEIVDRRVLIQHDGDAVLGKTRRHREIRNNRHRARHRIGEVVRFEWDWSLIEEAIMV